MEILVCGGRKYGHRRRVHDVLWALYEQSCITKVVHGAARGADSLAGRWAVNLGIATAAYPASWHLYGKAAGGRRNQKMLDQEPAIGLVVVFPGGTGTADMVRRALTKGILVYFVDQTPPAGTPPELIFQPQTPALPPETGETTTGSG